jgi:glycerol-3-phosphate dehydrogenase (NAD(P)+)
VPLLATGRSVVVWARRATIARELEEHQTNQAYLPGARVGPVRATPELAEALDGAELVLMCVPARALREVCRLARPHLPAGVVVVSTAKALDLETLERMSEVVQAELALGPERVTALSGPNFSVEVVRGLPTATVAAGPPAAARLVQDALMTERLRVYTTTDLCGVELGGALKNVMALAVGIADGMELGHNARAALVTRGLAEMIRLGLAMGAVPMTFAGLAGLGDLVLTCTGEYSRNRRAGLALGRGETLSGFLDRTGVVVEGIGTARAAWRLAGRYGVDMPVTEQVYHILFTGRSPREGLTQLMTRGRRAELDELASLPGFDLLRRIP